MNVKAFCAILEQVAGFQRLSDAHDSAAQIDSFVADLKRFGTLPLGGLFTFGSANHRSDPSLRVAEGSNLSASTLSKIIEQTSRLLRSGGSTVKANELAATAREIEKHGDLSASGLAEGVAIAQAEAADKLVDEYVSKLNKLERDSNAFENAVKEIGKLNAQIAIRIAAAYVQGRAKYASKPKALTAIRNKQYAQERFLHNTGKN